MQYSRLVFPLISIISSCFLLSCDSVREKGSSAPWGNSVADTLTDGNTLSLDEIISNGELIVLTLNGPDTYFDYHGRGMGTQYLLSEQFAQQLGVSLRVEVCRDTLDLINRLTKGDGDIIAFMMPNRSDSSAGLSFCGPHIDSLNVQWAVAASNKDLAAALDKWYRPDMLAKVVKDEKNLLSAQRVKRRVYAPFLNRASGVISKYDNLFRRYAAVARWDWRLLAAQCYQESCFDPDAVSWAGAHGLMQIMPSTADRLGLARSDMHNPEKSVEAAVRLLAELSANFRDIRSAEERQNFVLAAYNGGTFHIRDAMALTRKYGGNPYRWSNVSDYVLKLQQPQYYSDPVVKYGYMRGEETVDYVYKIRQRYASYRGVKFVAPSDANGSFDNSGSGITQPHPARKKHRFHI